jgi:hypothetical protein
MKLYFFQIVKARISGGFHFLSDPQELLVIDFQDPAQVKDALKHTKLFSRQFKVPFVSGELG